MTHGNPTSAANASASSIEPTVLDRGMSTPNSAIVRLKVSRSSPRSMTDWLIPIMRTPCSASTPARSSAVDRLRPVCPPRLGRRASGFASRMISVSRSRVSGSM